MVSTGWPQVGRRMATPEFTYLNRFVLDINGQAIE